jgi:glycosyltransferase involved in cell wall biosynthesis
MRLVTTLRGLASCGPTELFSVVPLARQDFDDPDGSLGLAKVKRAGFDDGSSAGWRHLSTLVDPRMPFGLPNPARSGAVTDLASFVSGRYDLVWMYGVRSWVFAHGHVPAPTVLDLDDLEDQKIEARLSIPKRDHAGPTVRLREGAARAFSNEEVRRWRRLHRRAARHVHSVVVCSRLDAARTNRNGVANVSVVPNGYRQVERPLGRSEVGSPPTVLFQGTLRYAPNAEAARYLATEIAPRLVELVPDARIRLVGPSAPALETLHRPPAITLVGKVPDIDEELCRADLVVVPVQFGSGTRVKVLEAFAHRIPVVSTTLGVEGLDAVDGEHLLIADDPAALAQACQRLLTDLPLRAAITARAHRLFLDRFQRQRIEEEVATVASVAAGAVGS